MKTNHHHQGFIYHPESNHLLLQQKIDERPLVWTLLEDLSLLKIKPKDILPIYDYVVKGKKCVVCYAEVKTKKTPPNTKTKIFQWFSVKEISKLPLSAQTKQDLIVGRRVIDSQIRRDAGELTIG